MLFRSNAVQATVQDMRNEMTEKINRTSVSYFDKHQFGDLLGRFTSDVETVSNALQQSFLQVVNAVFTLALVIGTVLYLNLQLGAIVVITIPITFFGARYIMIKSQPYFKQQADALGPQQRNWNSSIAGPESMASVPILYWKPVSAVPLLRTDIVSSMLKES